MNRNDRNGFGYLMGRIFSFVLVASLTAIVLAGTIRLVSWILPF